MGGSIKSSMTPGVSLSPATVSVIALLSTNAAAHNALAVDGISGNCRRWKAVLLDLSPLGPRLYLPTGWSGDAGSRRLSLNADGVVVGSVEVAPAGLLRRSRGPGHRGHYRDTRFQLEFHDFPGSARRRKPQSNPQPAICLTPVLQLEFQPTLP
jgi:hypothetical protein